MYQIDWSKSIWPALWPRGAGLFILIMISLDEKDQGDEGMLLVDILSNFRLQGARTVFQLSSEEAYDKQKQGKMILRWQQRISYLWSLNFCDELLPTNTWDYVLAPLGGWVTVSPLRVPYASNELTEKEKKKREEKNLSCWLFNSRGLVWNFLL